MLPPHLVHQGAHQWERRIGDYGQRHQPVPQLGTLTPREFGGPELLTQRGEVFAPRGFAGRVLRITCRVHPQLLSERDQYGFGRGLTRTQGPPEVAQHGELHRKSELVEVPSPLPHEPQIGLVEQVVPGKGAFVNVGEAGELARAGRR